MLTIEVTTQVTVSYTLSKKEEDMVEKNISDAGTKDLYDRKTQLDESVFELVQSKQINPFKSNTDFEILDTDLHNSNVELVDY